MHTHNIKIFPNGLWALACTKISPNKFPHISIFLLNFYYITDSSIIGIRSNYKDQIVKSNMKFDLSTIAPSGSTIGNGLAMATTSHQYVNQCSSKQKKLEMVNVHTLNGNTTSIVPENMKETPPPTITITSIDEPNTNIDGMLDRISHDLDYLLNRFETDDSIPPAPPPPILSVPISNVLHSHPSRSVHEVIIEEEPEET